MMYVRVSERAFEWAASHADEGEWNFSPAPKHVLSN